MSDSKKRTRITKACDACRGRRRKCDGKAPCSSCVVYATECTFTAPTRKRGPRTRQARKPPSNLSQRLKTLENLLDTISTGQIQYSDESARFSSPPRTERSTSPKLTETKVQVSKTVEAVLIPDPDDMASDEETDVPKVFVVRDRNTKRLLVYGPSALFMSRTVRGSRFLRRNYAERERISDSPYADQEEGSLSPTSASPKRPWSPNVRTALPRCPQKIVNYLVKLYFESVFPMFPMVDRQQIEQGLAENCREAPFMLLIYSMCLVVLPQTKHIHKAKWGEEVDDVETLEEMFAIYARSVLGELFDVADLLVIQACVNICLSACNAMPELNGTYYVAIAHRMAVELGMHRDIDTEYAQHLDTRTMETMKKTWYCLYLADKYLAAAEGRIQVIREDEYCTPLPLQEDGHVAYLELHVRLAQLFARLIGDVNGPNRDNRRKAYIAGYDLTDCQLDRASKAVGQLDEISRKLPDLTSTDGPRWGLAHHLKFMHLSLTAIAFTTLRVENWEDTLGPQMLETLKDLTQPHRAKNEELTYVFPYVDWFLSAVVGLLLDLGRSNLDLVRQMYPAIERMGEISWMCKSLQPIWREIIDVVDREDSLVSGSATDSHGPKSGASNELESDGEEEENEKMQMEGPTTGFATRSGDEGPMMGEEIQALLCELDEASIPVDLPHVMHPSITLGSTKPDTVHVSEFQQFGSHMTTEHPPRTTNVTSLQLAPGVPLFSQAPSITPFGMPWSGPLSTNGCISSTAPLQYLHSQHPVSRPNLPFQPPPQPPQMLMSTSQMQMLSQNVQYGSNNMAATLPQMNQYYPDNSQVSYHQQKDMMERLLAQMPVQTAESLFHVFSGQSKI